VLNDISADSKGGVYFTMGGVFYADSKGTVTRYGENLTTNGIVLSADEKHLFVTNGPTVAEFDVQKDGSLTNQHEFAKLEGGGNGDGSTFDSAGRLYVTSNAGVQVIGPDGKYLGLIPTPRGLISVAFSGPDRKMLYAVARENATNKDWIIGIQMIAQGPKGRAK
jgi:gluconolactonase